MPIINHIRGAYAPFKYALYEIRNSMFSVHAPDEKSVHGRPTGQTLKLVPGALPKNIICP